MTIVLTNDDGVGARRLMTMRAALERAGLATVVVAPENNQSGVSRAASYTNPVRVHRCDDGPLPVYAVAGTPVDCVRIALGALAPAGALDARPQLGRVAQLVAVLEQRRVLEERGLEAPEEVVAREGRGRVAVERRGGDAGVVVEIEAGQA